MKSRWIALAFAASLTTGAMAARADTNTSAQALFEEGRRLMAAGQFADACPKFAESQRLDPGAGTLLNLALCYEKNEQLASAWATYNEAAADADRSGRPEWVKRGKDKAAALAPSLTTLTVTVAKNARIDGLEVTRDGQPISAAEWGVKVPIDGGDHVVEAHAAGRETWSTHVSAPAKNGALNVSVPLLVKSSVATKPEVTPGPKPHERDHATPEKPAQKGSTQRTVGVVLGAVGVIGLGLGGGFALNAMSKHNAAKKDCSADEAHCGPQGLSDYSDANKSADVATIAFIAGGALLVGGLVLYLTSPRGTVSTTALLRPGWTF